ncbi:B3 domain-containing transcription repressor VAL2 [Sesamum angolense]|uniref:B3 domain-containing transcription repressor VAL2 n=1 Tax=Sesamum angolense TaxID=2727404 RepID=A0AAE2BSD2_9LAMI|nr:B3 domain-containing transcription repressor VAL2 [Sesamum angolense]
MFHSDETGWRECASCGKRLHCGCIASSSLLELLDTGGVSCKGCSKSSKLPSTPLEEKHKACDPSTENGGDLHFCRMAPAQSGDDAENDRQEHLPPPQTVDTIPRKQEEDFAGSGEIGYKLLPSFNQTSIGPSKSCDALQETRSAKSVHESLVQTNLSISLSASSNSNSLPGVIAEERQLSTAICSFQQGSRPRHLLPRLPNSILAAGLETNSSTISQLRVARPPVEGRVKNQLLPRYWPRITDQELQQISGEHIFHQSLSQRAPLRIQDVKGKEWVFQFRFWPNNNSRMYVLEGVTPCIQSMQLQAGDTVTFSRMDPEGKLLMGFRKAPNSISVQKSLKGSRNSSMNVYSGNINPKIIEKNVTGDNLLGQPLLLPERKRRNIGPKSKRLLIDGHDSLELRLSWEEVQDMLRPPPSTKPSTISVEDHEFEEFEEPPVFGKRSIFTVRLSGEHEQWTQCDSCFKWRKMPIDVLLPPKWTCHDNVHDQASGFGYYTLKKGDRNYRTSSDSVLLFGLHTYVASLDLRIAIQAEIIGIYYCREKQEA